MKKRLLSLFLVICMAASFIVATPISVIATKSDTGFDNLTWELDDNGTLTVSGTGDMLNYSHLSDVPWSSVRNNITSAVINDGVTSIGSSAFSGCDNLTSITIPNSVISIGDSAFYYCNSLESIMIPSSVASIGDYAFSCCNSLTSINVDADNTDYCSIDGNLFNKDKTELIRYTSGKENGTYIIPNSVISIGNEAFLLCRNLTNIMIPNSVTSISYRAFDGCSSLESITIPNSVTSIDESSFSGCSNLKSINMSSSITNIGYGAFSKCDNLTDVYYGGSEADWNSIDINKRGNDYLTNAAIHYNSTNEIGEKTEERKNPFDDVKENEWFFESVMYAVENKFMNGVEPNKFAPNDAVTRAMLVTILYRVEGEPDVNESVPFEDVKADAYFATAVTWAKQNGIVTGVNEKEFAPNENITREQIAAIIYRYADFKGIAPTGAWAIRLGYADISEISDYAIESVMYCTLKGIMHGKDENKFAPKDNATRAEIATILQRFTGILPNTKRADVL